MRKAWSIAVLLLLFAGGCTTAGSDEDTLVLFPTASPAAVTTPPPSSMTLTVVNHSTEVICAVHVAPAEAAWSDNLLVGEVIVPGETGIFELAPGTYDLRADDCFGSILVEEPGVDMLDSISWRIVSGES